MENTQTHTEKLSGALIKARQQIAEKIGSLGYLSKTLDETLTPELKKYIKDEDWNAIWFLEHLVTSLEESKNELEKTLEETYV